MSASKKYTAGISDGMAWNAGGTTTIIAENFEEAKKDAEEWADAGDYPCDAPVSVTIVLRDHDGEEISRWTHRVPDSACSGEG